MIDALVWPDLVILGGGISKDADRFIHDLPARVRCVPAALQNRAGIVGAAMLAAEAAQLRRRACLREPRRWRARRRSAGASRRATPTATCRSSTTA